MKIKITTQREHHIDATELRDLLSDLSRHGGYQFICSKLREQIEENKDQLIRESNEARVKELQTETQTIIKILGMVKELKKLLNKELGRIGAENPGEEL